MADETWGAKVSTELKKEIGQLIEESGLSAKEFLEQLISGHKVSLLQGTDAQRSEDIQQVTYHLDKIKSSFIGLVEKGIDLKDKFAESLEQESMLHKGIVDQQQKQIKLAQDERDKAVLDKANLEDHMAEIAARNEELEADLKTNRLTIQMQQEKIDRVDDQADIIQALNDEIARQKNTADHQTKFIHELENESQRYKREFEQAQATLIAQENDAAKAREAIDRDATKALDMLTKVHAIELQRATLETEKRLLDEIHKIKDEYYLKLESLTTKNQELTERLHQKELEANFKTKKEAAPATPKAE